MDIETLDVATTADAPRDQWGRPPLRWGEADDGGRRLAVRLYDGTPTLLPAGVPRGATFPAVLVVGLYVSGDDDATMWPDVGALRAAIRRAGGGQWTHQLGVFLEVPDREDAAEVVLVKVGELALQPVDPKAVPGLEVVQ